MKDCDAILAYRAASAVEAYGLVGHLSNAGIDARVLGESLQGGYGGINVGTLNEVEVWVAGADREAATQLISTWRSELPRSTMPLRLHSHEATQEASEDRTQTFQFSLKTALKVTTFVALTAALVGRGVLPWLQLPNWFFLSAYTTLVILVFHKHGRRIFFHHNR